MSEIQTPTPQNLEPKIQNFDQSPEVAKIFEALSKAQAEMQPAKMDMKNPHYNSKYASLTACHEAYRGPLAKYGLCFTQQIFSIKETFYIRSMLGHISGQWISNIFKLIIDKQNMQGLGSAITYGRRYGVNALIGIVDTEDDDGNGASGKKPPEDPKTPPPEKPPAAKPPQMEKVNTSAQGLFKGGKPVDTSKGHGNVEPISPAISDAQRRLMFATMKENNWSEPQLKEYIKAVWKIDSTKDLDRRGFDILLKVIKASTFDNAIKELR